MRSKDKILEQFKKEEDELRKIYTELPGNWFLHEKIIEHLEWLEIEIEESLKNLENSIRSDIQRQLEKGFNGLMNRIKKHNEVIKNLIKKVKSKNLTQDLPSKAIKSMELLINEIHILRMESQLYPIQKIKNKKIWKSVLEGLKNNTYIPPDIDLATAKKRVQHFSNSELILALQFNTWERPYLMITLDNKKINMHIIKKGRLTKDLFISKLMNLLGIRHMVIDYKHKMFGNKVEHLNKIEFMKGKNIESLNRLSNRDEILAFSFLLGAACADAFVTNLSDRPLNMRIDEKKFKLLKRKPKHGLGNENPIYNIDYEFLNSTNEEDYIKGQFFSSRGLFILMFVDKTDLVKAKLKKEKVIEMFNKGYIKELKIITHNYHKNKNQIDILLNLNGVNYLKRRFSEDSYKILLKFENEIIPKIFIQEYTKAA